MDTQIVLIFCLCDDLLKALHYADDKQSQMEDAEVMTAAIAAMLYYRGTHSDPSICVHIRGILAGCEAESIVE